MNALANLYDPAYHDGIIAVAILIATVAVAYLTDVALHQNHLARFAPARQPVTSAINSAAPSLR